MTETILITGANRGIGLALTKISLMKNMNVEACCRNLRNSKELHELSQRHSNLNIHEMDYIHRDIKPDNILLAPKG